MLIAALVLIGLIIGLRGIGWLERRLVGRHQTVIRVNDTGVTRTTGSVLESVTWAELQRVTIMTTDEGPFAEDVWWLLEGTSGGVAVPGSAPEVTAVMTRLEGMPGYRPEAVVTAMGSTGNARFTVWERQV